MRSVMVIALACVSLIGACAGQMGIGLPTQRPNETYAGERRDFQGVLELGPRSCRHLVVDGASHFVIWPAGSWHAELVRLPNGQTIQEGQVIIGRGAFTPTEPLAGPEGSYWNTVFDICEVEAEALVLDTAALAP